MSDPNNYTVGWICAIRPEYVAAQAFLDEKHDAPGYVSPHDNNDYTLGRIGKHNVAIAVLPYGEYGSASAASVARDMLHSFPNIRIGLLVGISGGVPSPRHDIRLGDVVVGVSSNGKGSVFQYNYDDTLQAQGQSFQKMMFLNKPPLVLLSAVNGLMAEHEYEGNQLAKTVSSVLDGNSRLRKNFGRPRATSDKLYKSHYVHSSDDGESCALVCGDDPLNLTHRPERTHEDDDPAVHYGLIASANQLMKNAIIRDKLVADQDVLCFEMEAAGLMNHFPCLVIRGICDYSDSHKNDAWQRYAAMTASAYAKSLLYRIAPNRLEAEITIKDRLSDLVSISEQHLIVAKENVQIQKDFAKERLTESEQMCHQLFRLTASDKDATYEWYKDLVEERVEGTCMWFLHHKQFQKWLQQESGPLVVTADPGCGKSVLAKYLIDHGLPRSATICYFFFKDQDQNTIRQALCALLHQLFTQKPVLIKYAMAKFRVDGRGLINSTESLWEVLRKVVKDTQAGPIVIVLDALDECAEREFENLLKNIATQFSESNSGQGKLKYLLTCRPYEQIVSEFNCFPNIRIPGEKESDKIGQEINYVITHWTQRLSKKHNLPSQYKDEIECNLRGTPNRTYLWVFLIFKHLDKEVFKMTLKEIRLKIKTLPKTIHEAYEQILCRSKDDPMVRKALSIILVANRPLTLSEMNVALSLSDETYSFFKLDLEKDCYFESRLRSWCGLFIAVYNGKVSFLHHTAREFLLADLASAGSIPSGLKWEHSITIREAHRILADLCVLYLDLFNSTDGMEDGDQSDNIYALLDYAAKYWNTHLREAHIEDGNAILPSVLRICDENSNSYSVWFDLFWQTTGLQPTKNFTNLMVASYCGHTSVAKLCLENAVDIEAKDTIYSRTPLLWAAIEGRHDLIMILTERRADITANEHGRTALLLAAKHGHEVAVKLLLEAKADTEVKDTSYGQTPLLWAVKHGHQSVVKLLLEKKAYTEARDSLFGQTPLMWATENGHVAIVRLLLESGADIEAEDNIYGQTSVLLAVNKCHGTILKLLLRNGANFETKNKGGWTLLSWAVARKHTSIVSILLEWAAYTKNENENSEEALLWAIKERHEEIAKLLLKQGISVDMNNGRGQMLLRHAIEWGSVLIVELLLRSGVNVNQIDGIGETPLIWAIKKDQPRMVELLLSKGAYAAIDDTYLIKAREWAIRGNKEDVNLVLLREGRERVRREPDITEEVRQEKLELVEGGVWEARLHIRLSMMPSLRY